MIDSKNINLDDEFRVLGRSSSRLPNHGGDSSRIRLCITIIAAIILLTIGIYGIIKWPNRAVESHNKENYVSFEKR